MLAKPWRLRYSGTDMELGTIDSGYVFPTAPEVGPPDIETDDTVRPRADGLAFGLDYYGGRVVTFEIDVVGEDEVDTRARLSTLSRAWRADPVRRTAGATAELVSDSGRIAYGRPRRFASNDELIYSGVSEVVADFTAADTAWYAESPGAVSIDITAAPGGGFVAPFVFPLTSSARSDRSTVIDVGGEVRTWPRIEITGPITDPEIEVLGAFRLAFRLTLADGDTLVVDTAPWSRTALRNGASVRGALTRTSTRLSQAALDPGSHELAFRGTSPSGTARASITWHDAYLTP